MQSKKIRIGSVCTGNNVFLAPLAGYTNAVFRRMCARMGASLTYTEMVSAKGLVYGSDNTFPLLRTAEGDGSVHGCQLFGNDPEFIRRAAESAEVSPFDIIDINMGCPVPKIFKNGEGAALLGNMPLASEIIKAAKKSGKNVSVKFRTGITPQKKVTRDFAKMCEDSGADMITVHGRTRDMMYSGDVDTDEIAAAKAAVKIPVIANGGVMTPEDADRLLKETGADGVMIARGAMYSPWIFAEITGNAYDIKDTVLTQIRDTREMYGEHFAVVYMRKMAGFYLKGRRGAAEARKKLFTLESTEEIETEAEKLFS